MNYRRLVLIAVAFTLLAVPLFAQRRIDVDVFATWVNPSASDKFSDLNGRDFTIDLKHANGGGVAVNVFWGSHISSEFALSSVKSALTLHAEDPQIEDGKGTLQMVPLTAILQFHLAPDSVIDPYIGAGVGYVQFDELRSLQFSQIDFKDDAALALNAGLTIKLGRRLGLYADGKYIRLKSSTEVTNGEGVGTKFKINPAIVAGGLSFQF